MQIKLIVSAAAIAATVALATSMATGPAMAGERDSDNFGYLTNVTTIQLLPAELNTIRGANLQIITTNSFAQTPTNAPALGACGVNHCTFHVGGGARIVHAHHG